MTSDDYDYGDLPEHDRPDFSGYAPDSPYFQRSQEMAYFKRLEGLVDWPKTYGEQEPPTNKEVLDFNQLIEDVNSKTFKSSLKKQFTLAWHYEHGIDSKLSNIHKGNRQKDYKKAMQLYEGAYKEGSGLTDEEEGYWVAIDAAHQIGILYEKGGNGIKQDYSKAASWYFNGIELTHKSDRLKSIHFKKSISSYTGTRDSHITLARLHIEGLGVPVYEEIDFLKWMDFRRSDLCVSSIPLKYQLAAFE
jgi:hypothetical protein